ncbi:MAG: hypothetical protein V3R84_05545 [Acidimicrobiia bacterium]
MTGPSSSGDRALIGEFAVKIADAAAERLPGYSSIIWKGSTHKPWDGPFDFLPGLSDIDIHVYRNGALDEPWGLRRAVLDAGGPVPFDTPLQLLVLDTTTLPEWWTILPGTYEVMHGGEPPTTVPSTSRLLERDRYGLAGAAADAARVSYDVLGLSDAELWPYLRSVRSLFPPALYRAASVWTGRPERAWSLNRTGLLAFAEEHLSLADVTAAAVQYFAAALAACANRDDPQAVELALRAGQGVLVAASEWFAARPDAVVDRRIAEPPL